MLFDVYGPNAGFQWLGLAMVLIALILLNEFARRTKTGGIICFLVLPAVLTWLIAIPLRKWGWIKDGDLKLDL